MDSERHVAFRRVLLAELEILMSAFQRHCREDQLAAAIVVGSGEHTVEVFIVVFLPSVDAMKLGRCIGHCDLGVSDQLG